MSELDIAYPLNIKISGRAMEILESEVTRQGGGEEVRGRAVDKAILVTYGPCSAEAIEAERQRKMKETKAAYVAAIEHLFQLLAMPADKKGPEHKAEVMDANNACGEARVAMIEAWEGEEDSAWHAVDGV